MIRRPRRWLFPRRLDPVPNDLTTKAVVPGMENIRYWMDGDLEPLVQVGIAAYQQEREYLGLSNDERLPPIAGLAISGGGDNGAFGAGLLVGWTEAGDRPEFKYVTGISTGALMAPFAFLGSTYDEQLQRLYTTISPKDVLKKRGVHATLYDDALSDNGPLCKLVESTATNELLRAIGEEYEKGRILMVATTDLDARRPVMWNIGAMALSGHPKAVELFQSILVASAAIPGVFPPIMIDVEVDGRRYQEMHVDGGAMAQAILYPPSYVESKSIRTASERRTLYVIRNARVDPDWSSVQRRTLSIATRAIASLLHSQGIGDLYKIYVLTQRDDIDFNLAVIGSDFTANKEEDFDNAYMRELFKYGYQQGQNGYPWKKYPPDFTPLEDR